MIVGTSSARDNFDFEGFWPATREGSIRNIAELVPMYFFNLLTSPVENWALVKDTHQWELTGTTWP